MYRLATKHTEQNEQTTIRQVVAAAGMRCKQSLRQLSVYRRDAATEPERLVDRRFGSAALPYVVRSTIDRPS